MGSNPSRGALPHAEVGADYDSPRPGAAVAKKRPTARRVLGKRLAALRAAGIPLLDAERGQPVVPTYRPPTAAACLVIAGPGSDSPPIALVRDSG